MLITETDGRVTGLMICGNCLFVVSNGVESEDDQTAADGMAREWPDHDIVGACPEDCEGEFSMSDCHGCGSSLGGDRHPAVAFPRV